MLDEEPAAAAAGVLDEAAAAAAGVPDAVAATAAGELAEVARVLASLPPFPDPLVVEATVVEEWVFQYCSRADSTPALLR